MHVVPALLPLVSGYWQWRNPVPRTSTGMGEFFTAFLRFINEPFVATTPTEAPRASRRRAERSGRPVRAIRMIALRQRRSAPSAHPEHQDVEWSHRWIVRGHWRQQWYPSQNRHAPRWILPYVKGPEGKPLVAKRRVFNVER